MIQDTAMGYSARESLHQATTLPSHRSYTILDLEVDPGCGAHSIHPSQSCSPINRIDLYGFDELPGYMKWNPYIKQGYRAFLPLSHCFSSLFVWSNETINIWSHLIGFCIFFAAMFADNVTISSTSRSQNFTDHIFITLGLICYQACMLLSSGYHLFFCHSEKACKRWLAMDLAGISIGLIGCYLPSIQLAFYCHQIWRDFYMIVVLLLASATLGLQFHPRYMSHSWSNYRTILYSSVAAYGIIPALHWVKLEGGLEAEIVKLFAGKVVNIYLLASLAFIFYVTKFPESLFPGQVDFIGSSHQWWHVIVVIAFLYWHRAGEVILQYRIDVPCTYT